MIVFSFMEDIEDSVADPDVYADLQSKESASIVIAIVLQVIFFLAEGFAFYFVYYKASKTLEVML